MVILARVGLSTSSATGVPPTVAVVSADRFLPLMVTTLPPAVEPLAGLSPDSTGAPT